MAWWLRLHGLTVAMVGGGCGSCSRITEVAVVVPRRVAVAVWHGGRGCGHIA
jgi:hypothetical protein